MARWIAGVGQDASLTSSVGRLTRQPTEATDRPTGLFFDPFSKKRVAEERAGKRELGREGESEGRGL